jgi:hypothetical protein
MNIIPNAEAKQKHQEQSKKSDLALGDRNCAGGGLYRNRIHHLYAGGSRRGMVMDSCSGQVIGWLWIAWLWVLWGLVLLVSALVPSILIIKNRRWRWVFASMFVGAMASVMWYVLWYVIVIGAFSLLGSLFC